MNNEQGIQKIIFLTVFTISFGSCSKNNIDKDCLEYTRAFVSKVEGPSTGQINQEVNFQVYFGVHNGCGQFGNFEESIEANSRLIKVIAKYEGCICTQDAPGRIGDYKFRTSQTGTYFLKFLQVNNNYLTK